MRGENWEEIHENKKGRIMMAGDFSVIVNPYLWKRLENDDDIFTYFCINFSQVVIRNCSLLENNVSVLCLLFRIVCISE